MQQFKVNEKSSFQFLDTIDSRGIDKRLLSPIYVWLNFNFFHVSCQPPGIVKPLVRSCLVLWDGDGANRQ